MLLETVTWRDNLIFANWLNFQGLCQLLVQRNQPQSCISRWGQCNIQKHFKWSISVWCDLKSESDNSLHKLSPIYPVVKKHAHFSQVRQILCHVVTLLIERISGVDWVPYLTTKYNNIYHIYEILDVLVPIPYNQVVVVMIWCCLWYSRNTKNFQKYIFYLWYILNLIWCEYFYNSTMTQACGRCCEPC